MGVNKGRSWSVSVCSSAFLLLSFICGAAGQAFAATHYVNSGGDLQAALNAAQPGDEIVIQAGARFTGTFRLPAKPAGPVITVRSSAVLPNRRVTPSDASLMPTLVSPTVEPALIGENVANWLLDGLRFESNPYGEYNIVHLQDAANITMDRLLIVAGQTGQKRAIMGNGRFITLTRSHIANIWKSGQDSQAFCAWDGAGPYTLRDNYLEAASENVMFGGANSRSADRIPSDILVEGNHFSKPLSWKGQPRAVKNLFELKSARRVVVRNNLFERNWTDAQNGYAILFTVRNDEGGSPWSVVEDVLFERNIVRDTENGINVLGYDSYQPSGRTTRVTIRHNLILTTGTFLMVGSEVGELTVDHNTVEQPGNFGTFYKGEVWIAGARSPRAAQYTVEKLILTNTLANHGSYGLWGEDAGIGTSVLTALTRSYTWANNVLAGESGWGQAYPAITWQPGAAEHKANFNADYSLATTSVYRRAATDGTDLGAAIANTTVPPPPAEVCGDGIDNDRDGAIDEGCTLPLAEVCGDGIDNDLDGAIDEGCAPPAEICGDGIDNDRDGAIDEGCAPPPAEVCGDGIDNDRDGAIDEGCVIAPADSTGPTVSITNVFQNRNSFKFRVEASDPSGIASVKVEFRGSIIASSTSVPLNVTIQLQKVPAGLYGVTITVIDKAGNATVESRTFTR